jgi:hypothetical protein
MSLKEEKKSSKSSDIKDELKEMLAESHKDQAWIEKFKALVRNHFDI